MWRIAFWGIAWAVLSARGKTLSFEETLRLAMQKSPTLAQFAEAATLRNYEYSNSWSVFLPSLDFTAVHGLRGQTPSPYATPYSSAFTLQLKESLYDNGVSLLKYDSAQRQREIAQLNFQNERDKLLLEVARTRTFFAARLDISLKLRKIIGKTFFGIVR